MVKKFFCDKCGQEIEVDDDYVAFESAFCEVSLEFEKECEIVVPQLCNNCKKGYQKIIIEANNKIKDYCGIQVRQ